MSDPSALYVFAPETSIPPLDGLSVNLELCRSTQPGDALRYLENWENQPYQVVIACVSHVRAPLGVPRDPRPASAQGRHDPSPARRLPAENANGGEPAQRLRTSQDRHRDQWCRTEQISKDVFHRADPAGSLLVWKYLSRLRQKFDPEQHLIVCSRNRGYRLATAPA
jgi:hypothetical protein